MKLKIDKHTVVRLINAGLDALTIAIWRIEEAIVIGICISCSFILALVPFALGMDRGSGEAQLLVVVPGLVMAMFLRMLIPVRHRLICLPALLIWTLAAVFGLSFGMAHVPASLLTPMVIGFALAGFLMVGLGLLIFDAVPIVVNFLLIKLKARMFHDPQTA